MILLIDNFDSFTCNIAAAFNELGQDVLIKKNNSTSLDEIEKDISPSALIIGPGPGEPKDAGISLSAIKYFQKKLPILGICLGHQAIFEVFGGSIIKSKYPMHGISENIIHNKSDLFISIPEKCSMVRYNSLTAKNSTVPECLEITAKNAQNEIMAIKHKTLLIYGVQFHPESIFTEYGKTMLNNFLKITSNN